MSCERQKKQKRAPIVKWLLLMSPLGANASKTRSSSNRNAILCCKKRNQNER